jgi:hypothetical protein
MRREIVGGALKTSAADDIESERVRLEDANFGLEGEIVVEGVGDGGGLPVGGGVVESEGAVGFLLDLDDRGGLVMRARALVVKKRQTEAEGERRDDPYAPAHENGEEIGDGPLDGRVGGIMKQKLGAGVHGRVSGMAARSGIAEEHHRSIEVEAEVHFAQAGAEHGVAQAAAILGVEEKESAAAGAD